jgi:hypothetical protein
LPSPFVLSASIGIPCSVSGADALTSTSVRAVFRSTPGVLAPDGLGCPALPRLIDPMRPTHQHIPTSPHRLIRNAPRCMSLPRHLSDQPVVPCFHCTFLPSMPPSKTSGSPLGARAQFYPNGIGLAPTGYRLGTPGYPRHPLQTGHASRGFTTVRFRYGLLSCSPL